MDAINVRIAFPLTLQPVLTAHETGGTSFNEISYQVVIWIKDAAGHRLHVVKPQRSRDQTAMTLDLASRATGYVRWLEEAAQTLKNRLPDPAEARAVRRTGWIELRRTEETLVELNLLVALETVQGEEFDRVRSPIAILQPADQFNFSLNEVLENSERREQAAAKVMEELIGLLGAWSETDRVAPSGSAEIRINDPSVE